MQNVYVSPLCTTEIDETDPLSPGDGPVSISAGTRPAGGSGETETEF